MNLTGQKLFYYGVIILLFQNILFELFSFLYVESMLGYNSNSVFFLTLYPDLVGFFLLGLGYKFINDEMVLIRDLCLQVYSLWDGFWFD